MADVGDVTSSVTSSAKSIPPMVWVVVIGGGLAFAFYRSKNAGTGSTAGGAAAQPEALVYTGTGGAGAGGSGSTGATTPSTPTQSSTTPQTNEEWARAATNYLLGQNYPADLVDSAIRSYLAGQSLSSQQNALIVAAIRAIGAVPQLLPPTTAPPPVAPVDTSPPAQVITPPTPAPPPVVSNPTPAPAPPPPPPAPAARYYTVRSGDSLWKIAQGYYGNGSQWPTIYNANRDKIKNPNLIYVGQVFLIP